jgi:hypothetical protein
LCRSTPPLVIYSNLKLSKVKNVNRINRIENHAMWGTTGIFFAASQNG